MDPGTRDHRMNTPLHSAMTDGYSDTDYSANPEVVRLLLGSGADVDAKNDTGSTPLHSAAGHRQPATAQLLLAHGADATSRNDFGITPLHSAAGAAVPMTVTLLLDQGADVNAADDKLRTPLHRAADSQLRSPSAETIALLLDRGADINTADQAGDTPLHLNQSGMCISRVLKTTERTLILQPQISIRSLLDRRRYLTIPVLGLLQLAPQPQTNETFGE